MVPNANGTHASKQEDLDETMPLPRIRPAYLIVPNTNANNTSEQQDPDETMPLALITSADLRDRILAQAFIEHETIKLVAQGIERFEKRKVPKQPPWQLLRVLLLRARSNSLLRNSFHIMSTGVATSVFGYLFWILAAHLYSPFDVGLGSALIGAMNLASLIANLGMSATLVQVLPQREAGKPWSLTVNACLVTGILAGVLTGVIGVLILPILSPQFSPIHDHAVYAFAFIVGVPIMIVSTLLDQTFIAERASQNMLVRNATVSALKIPLLVLPVILMLKAGGIGVFGSGILAMAAVAIGSFLFLIPRLKRDYRLALRGITGQVRSLLSLLTGNYFINLGGLATMYLLPVIVTIRLSAVDTAYSYTTERVSDFILIGSSAVATSLFAEGSHTAERLPQKVRTSARIISMLLVPGIIVCFLGGHLILSIFGPSYVQHGLLLLKINALASIPDAITNVYVSVLRVQRRMRFGALLNLAMAGLALVFSWILLPILGIPGQGVAFLIAQGTGTLAAGVDLIFTRYKRKPEKSASKNNA